MKTKKKMIFKNVMAVFMMCALILATLGTYAWFTDKQSFSSSDLEFGTIKLDVSGDSIDGNNVNVKVSRWGTTQGKLMPGDDVSVKVKVGLTSTSEDAYYLLALTDNKGVFEDAVYYYDGTQVQKFDGTTPAVGSLKATDSAHEFNIDAEIPEDYETQGGSVKVSLKVYAIQQANMGTTTTEAVANAFDKLYYPMCGVSLNSSSSLGLEYTETEIGFYYTSSLSSLSGYTLDSDKTATLNSKLATFDQGKNLIQVYTNGTKLAYVSDYEMFAPENCTSMFGIQNDPEYDTSKSIILSNFNTSRVTNMREMFAYCYGLTSIEGVENLDTSNVTDMNSMFLKCRNLTTLDTSSFDTSNVTDMNSMFWVCSTLTTLDISSFDTSNVTDMGYMFFTCSTLTTINVGDGWVINEGCNTTNMFYNCGTDHVTVV